jgi:hypothetical protein
VLRRSDASRKKNCCYFWVVQCSCGSEPKLVRGSHLIHGRTKACGCDGGVKEHGESGKYRTPEFSVWVSIIQRCDYGDYKGRVLVCERWRGKGGYERFLSDMGRKPSIELTIDRKDSTGHYSCGHCNQCIENGWADNCRWATREEQNNNRSCCRKLVLPDGRTLGISQLCRELGLTYAGFTKRLKLGWSFERATTTPARPAKNRG